MRMGMNGIRTRALGLVAVMVAAAFLGTWSGAGMRTAGAQSAGTRAYFPVIMGSVNSCDPIPGAHYGTLSPIEPYPAGDPPPEEHPDLNLAVRGYAPTVAYLGPVDYGPSEDPAAPQLTGLYDPARIPAFTAAYQVFKWDWDCMCRGPLNTDPPVTLIDVATQPGEQVHVPPSGYEIGAGYEVLVLYAAENRITLKYTAEDHVVYGYTLHIEGICVDPNLLALYEQLNAAGRSQLPALVAGQAFGYSPGTSYGVGIRDTGTFMDPRSRLDWWR